MQALYLFLALAPGILLLVVMVFFDSFKLVSWRALLASVAAGSLVALLIAGALFLVMTQYGMPFASETWGRYLSPLIEEIGKAAVLVILLYRTRIGFVIDAAIHGAAIGIGFALAENLLYLSLLDDAGAYVWTIRGFGTAIMHAMTTSVLGILAKRLTDQYGLDLLPLVPGLIIAVLIHAAFNHFPLPPWLQTSLQWLLLPPFFVVIYRYGEASMQHWLNINLDMDVRLLEYLESGQFRETPAGRYVAGLSNYFSGEVLADMLCLLRLRLELACKAKGALLMQEAGFAVPADPALEASLAEIAHLQKSIGKTALRTIAPILNAHPLSAWETRLLRNR